MAFELPQLPYANDALEPHIDAKTMEIHHGKHHNGYTTKLNGALEGSGMESDTIETILENLDMNNASSEKQRRGLLQPLFVLGSDEPQWRGNPFGCTSTGH